MDTADTKLESPTAHSVGLSLFYSPRPRRSNPKKHTQVVDLYTSIAEGLMRGERDMKGPDLSRSMC